MAVKANRTELLDRVRAVQWGLTPRDGIDQSSCVAIVGGHAMTYNEKIFCRTPIPVPPDLTGAVPGKRLIEVLEKMSGDEVNIGVNGTTISVYAGQQRSQIRVDHNILLPYKDVERPQQWHPIPDGFNEALRMVDECVGPEKRGFKLSCVHLAPGFIEACDGIQVLRHRTAMKLSRDGVFRGGFGGALAIARSEPNEYAETDKWLHFRNPAKTIVSVRWLQENYPDMAPMLKFRGTKTPLPRSLTEAAEFANTFAQENGDAARVLVEVSPPWITVTGEGATGSASERMGIKYNGPPFSFRIGPKSLGEIVERATEAELGEETVPGIAGAPDRAVKKLRVDGGRWVYLTNLGTPPPPGGKPKEEASSG